VEVSRKNALRDPENPEQKKIAQLTVREREIIALAASNAGATARAIAEKLSISEHTLRNHLTSIYEKLGVANRLELYAYAHQQKLAEPVALSK
jgi:DNA-binding CsgD family transcriptional regulator